MPDHTRRRSAVAGKADSVGGSGVRAPGARRAGILLFLVVALPFFSSLAHPDFAVVEQNLRIAPGEVTRYPLALHFHRLVGRYDTGSATDLTMLVVDDSAFRSSAAGARPATERHAVELSGKGRINLLVDCCIGSEYSDFHLLLRNDGVAPVDLDLRLWAVHDDFAVVAQRAEGGALEFPLAIFLGLVGWAAWSVRRGRRRAGELGQRSVPRSLPVSFWASLCLFGMACGAAAALGTAGSLRYGAGPVDGMVAIMADLPVPGGIFGSRDALVMGLLLLAWSGAIAFWIRAVEQDAHLVSAWPSRLGIALGAVSVAAGAAMAATYGVWPVPFGLGLLLGAPLVALAAGLRRPLPSYYPAGRQV